MKRFYFFFPAALLVITDKSHASPLSSRDDYAEDHPTRLAEALDLSCHALFDQAEMIFASFPIESQQYSAALHSLGNIAAIKGDLLMSGMYHARAKLHNSTQRPPLAVMYLEHAPCNNIGDLFWTSSFTKKKIYETFFSLYYRDHRKLLSVHLLQDLIDRKMINREEIDILFDSHIGLATQLEDSGLMEYSSQHFTQALILHPESIELYVRTAIMVPVLYDSLQRVEESRQALEQKVQELIAWAEQDEVCRLSSLNHLSMPGTFYIAYQGYNDARLMRDIRYAYSLLYPKLQKVYLSSEEGYALLNPPPPSDGRIRIGIASHYFRHHSVCKLICGVIHGLDETLYHVTLFSSTEKEDAWTDYVRERSDRFVRVKEGMLLRNRNIPFDQNLDILLYPDIGMESGSVIWAHSRLAKIQLCFWGHPTTTGLDHMDYFITSDLFEDSNDAQERFTEQLVRMDSLSFFFHVPQSIMSVPSSENNAGTYDVTSLGIPQDAVVLLVPQTLPKFHPQFDQVLHDLLRHNDNVHIIAIYNKDKMFWKNKLTRTHARPFEMLLPRRLRSRFHNTVSSEQYADRLTFLPTQDATTFVRLVQRSTVLLDPFPFGGGVTSLEAFAACKAVVTAPSLQSVPALTSGMIHVLNLTEALIATSQREYLQLVVRLIEDKSYRQEIEDTICKRNHQLYGQEGVVREWEALFTALTQQE